MIFVLSLLGVASAQDMAPCLTLDLLQSAPALNVAHLPPPPDGERTLFTQFGASNVRTSEHFAVHWGRNGASVGITASDALVVLDAMEAAWDDQVDGFGMEPPSITEAHFFNVYLSDTGDQVPGNGGAAGYYTRDRNGNPYIVINSEYLNQSAEQGKKTSLHEFHHALQDQTGAFKYEDRKPSGWYWEATATWAPLQSSYIKPDISSVYFLIAYALQPHLSLEMFDYPDSGTLRELHHYGAFLFPQYLSEIAADEQLVVDVWQRSTRATPVATLKDLLAERGLDFNEVWLDHVAANVKYSEYGDRGIYLQAINAGAPRYPSDDDRIVGTLEPDGTYFPPPGLAPQRYGANVWEIDLPDEPGELVIQIEGNAAGSAATPAAIGARMVLAPFVGRETIEPVTVDARSGTYTLDLAADDAPDSAYLVIGTWGTAFVFEETFGYSITTEFIPAPEPEDPDPVDPVGPVDETPRGCACASAGSVPTWSLLGLLPLMGLIRRRRTY